MKFCIDFEMNQFSDRIISMGVIAEDGRTFYTLMQPSKPGEKITKFITELTGITQEMIDEAPSADEAFDIFFGWLQDYYSDEVPEYYCYGNSDKQAIKNTTKYMTELTSIVTAQSIAGAMVDYAPKIKDVFNTTTPVGLARVYNFMKQKNEEQNHNALEDAKMLQYVMKNFSMLKPEDVSNLPKSTHRNRSTAPAIYKSWANGRGKCWTANTLANAENWGISARNTNNEQIKYFNNVETAALWMLKYFTTSSAGLTAKNPDHIQKLINQINEAINSGKKFYGMEWKINI